MTSKVKVLGYSISLDGFGAGPDQSLKNPLGVGGMKLHPWLLGTRTFRKGHGGTGGTGGIDEKFAARSMKNIGAWIMGRNMFAPGRGEWDLSWKGWWGEDPVYHCDVFVLTHYKREPLVMKGGTTFHFVTDGIRSALNKAKAAAKGNDIRVGGGAATVRQYIEAGLVDEMHLAISPVLLGSGENLLAGLDLVKLGYKVAESTPSPKATHLILRRT